jgi:protein-S-isoprenylcysteine O-methyltransferase Ste14
MNRRAWHRVEVLCRRFEPECSQITLAAARHAYLIGTPLALGSYWGLLALPFMISFLIWRLVDEEKFLQKNLPGYMEYQKKIRHHLVPYVW